MFGRTSIEDNCLHYVLCDPSIKSFGLVAHGGCFLLANQQIHKYAHKPIRMQPLFLAYCFQTCKDHSDPKSTPPPKKILFTHSELDLPLCCSLSLRKQVACWLNPEPLGPPETLLYEGISLSSIQASDIRFMFVHTQKDNLLTALSSL